MCFRRLVIMCEWRETLRSDDIHSYKLGTETNYPTLKVIGKR